EDEDNKSDHSNEQTDDLNCAQPFAFAKSPENDCCLDRAEQKERARSGRESVVGKRESRGVSKERQSGDPIAGGPHPKLLPPGEGAASPCGRGLRRGKFYNCLSSLN